MEKGIITNVMGFDFDIKLIDREGKVVPKGHKTTPPILMDDSMPSYMKASVKDTRWFDHYDERLLEKIKDYRRLND